MLLQAITIRDQRYAPGLHRRWTSSSATSSPAAPCLRSSAMLQVISTGTDMNLLHLEDFGPHYARTLRLGTTTCATPASTWSSSATTTHFFRSGSSTCATARAASSNAPSAPPSCCWPSPARARRRCSATSAPEPTPLSLHGEALRHAEPRRPCSPLPARCFSTPCCSRSAGSPASSAPGTPWLLAVALACLVAHFLWVGQLAHRGPPGGQR